jgi:aspartate ammonia-lyase
MRTESDSMGTIEVSDDVYWGAQTAAVVALNDLVPVDNLAYLVNPRLIPSSARGTIIPQ